MVGLDDIYCKFGEASEVGQMIELELLKLLEQNNPVDHEFMNKMSDESCCISSLAMEMIEKKLSSSLTFDKNKINKIYDARNAHRDLLSDFYIKNKENRYSNSGREFMLDELMEIHWRIFEGYRFIMSLSNFKIPDLSVSNHLYLKFVNN